MKMSPLAAACKEGHPRIVKLMLMSGADFTKQSSKKTPLEWAREEAARDPYTDELVQEADALLVEAASRGGGGGGGGGKVTPNNNKKETKEERDKRYAETIKIMENPHLCACCGESFPPNKLKRCGKCKKVKYCSVDCQKKGWIRFHKMQCNIWAERVDMLLHRNDGKPKQTEVPNAVDNE